jgi:phenolic acid decarboxylase
MKNVLARFANLALLLALIAIPVLAAKNSQRFFSQYDVRVGDTELKQGHWVVTWSDSTGTNVQLTIKTDDKKTVTVSARVVNEKNRVPGVETFLDNNVHYLGAIHASDATYVVKDHTTAAAAN